MRRIPDRVDCARENHTLELKAEFVVRTIVEVWFDVFVVGACRP
jgi:hypothetical protein